MKALYVFLLSLVVASGLPLAAEMPQPYAYYRFDRNAPVADSCGGAPCVLRKTLWASGFSGDALRFPAQAASARDVSPVATLPLPAEFFARPFSVSFWTRLDGDAVREAFGDFLSLGGEAGPGFRLYLFYGELNLRTGTPEAPQVLNVSELETSLPRETWTQLTMTYDGEAAALYRDGALLKRAELAMTAGNGPLTVGSFQAGFAYPMQGAMDEVRVFDRALAPREVAELYLDDLCLVSTTAAPVLDGRLDDKEWVDIPWQSGFATIGAEGRTPREDTRFKTLWTAQGLWLGVECEDAYVVSRPRLRDEGTWEDDCVEVFVSPHAEVNPDPNLQEYYQFIANAAGAVFDGHSVGGSLDAAWECRFRAATARTALGWSLELFLPYAAFLPCDLDAWCLLVAREDVLDAGGTREVVSLPQVNFLATPSEYAPLAGLPANPARFGAMGERLGLEAVQGEDGPRGLLAGSLQSPSDGEFELKCQVLDGMGTQAAFAACRISCSGGQGVFRLPLELTEGGDYTVRLWLLDEEGVVLQTSLPASLELSRLVVKTLWPRQRDTLLASMADRTARFQVACRLPDEELDGTVLAVRARRADGGVAAGREWPVDAGEMLAEIPLEGVGPGEVKVEFELRMGETTLEEAVWNIRVLEPQPGNELYIDALGRIVVNGRPVFLRGFYGCDPGSEGPSAEQVRLLRESGCNVVQSYSSNTFGQEELRRRLDWAGQNGLKVMLYPYPRMGSTPKGLRVDGAIHAGLDDELRGRIASFVASVKDHPALLGWFLFDEPRDAAYKQTLREINALVHETDPAHLTFGCNDSGRGCLELADCADVLMPDIYPAPVKGSEKMKKPLAGVFNQVRDVVRGMQGNAVCYTPQAFDWDSFKERPNEHRPPSYLESRAAVWAAVVAGSRAGIVPYTIGDPRVHYGEHHGNAGVFASPELKIGFLEGVMPELAALEEALLAPDAAVPAVCDNPKVRLVTRTVARNGAGCTYVFAVNVLPEELGTVEIRWPNDLLVRVLGEQLPLSQEGCQLTLAFGKYAVHILTDDPKPLQVISVEEVRRHIEAEK